MKYHGPLSDPMPRLPMKTPEELVQIWIQSCQEKIGTGIPFGPEAFIEYVQRDALSGACAQTLDQHELDLVKDIDENLEYQLQIRTQELAEMRGKWHETRRYLRQANKGAERNNMVMRLQAETIHNLLAKLKKP